MRCYAPTGVDSSGLEAAISLSSEDGNTAVRADLARIAHAAALALRDPEVRARVYADIHASPDPEKKLSLRSYLDGPGASFRQSMASSANLTRDQLSTALLNLPEVDLYMPVASHREQWSGDAQVIVAYQLKDRDIPDGFDLDGRRVILSRAAPPSIPALVVVPQERPVLSRTDVLALSEECTPEMIICDDPNDPPPPPPPPDGLYIDKMRIRHDGESWPRGEPELEVHVTGTQNGVYWVFTAQPPSGLCPNYPGSISPGVGPCVNTPWQNQWLNYSPDASQSTWVACSGEKASGARRFDFNSETTHNQDVLIAEAQTFFVNERITDNQGGIMHRRKDGLNAPVTILITERDDGDQCPDPAGKRESYSTFTVQWRGGGILQPTQSSFEHLIHRILGNGNDELAFFVLHSFTTLEAASNLYMAGADVDIWLTNNGFDHTEIPPDEDPYWGF